MEGEEMRLVEEFRDFSARERRSGTHGIYRNVWMPVERLLCRALSTVWSPDGSVRRNMPNLERRIISNGPKKRKKTREHSLRIRFVRTHNHEQIGQHALERDGRVQVDRGQDKIGTGACVSIDELVDVMDDNCEQMQEWAGRELP